MIAVVGIFNHAVSKELVTIDKVLQLRTLEALKYGQTDAPEGEEREPANLAHVRATAKHLSPIVKAMLRVQVLRVCGQRKSFRCVHATSTAQAPYGSTRQRVIRPSTKASHVQSDHCDAREAITDYLARDAKAFLFSPAEALAWMRAQAAAKRVTR